MCESKIGFVEGDVVADGPNAKPRLFGPWMLLFGGTHLDTTLDIRALEASCGVQVGWRTAPVQSEAPNAWETLLTSRTADNTYAEAASVSAKTSDLLVQAVVWAGLTTGTAPKTAHVRLWSAVRGAGWVVARQRVQLLPSSTNVILPIGDPFNCPGVTDLMFAVQFVGIQGTIVSPSCEWRSFETADPRKPGAWVSSALHTFSNVTADAGVNSGTLPVTTSGKLMAQAGLRYSTSGSDPNGFADVIVAAKM